MYHRQKEKVLEGAGSKIKTKQTDPSSGVLPSRQRFLIELYPRALPSVTIW